MSKERKGEKRALRCPKCKGYEIRLESYKAGVGSPDVQKVSCPECGYVTVSSAPRHMMVKFLSKTRGERE